MCPLGDPMDVRLTRNSPPSKVSLPATRIRSKTLQIMQEAAAKLTLRRLTRSNNAYTGKETRHGDCEFLDWSDSKRSASRWRGSTEVIDGEWSAAVPPYQSGIRKVPQNRAQPQISPTDSPRRGPGETPPVSDKSPPGPTLGNAPESPLAIGAKTGNDDVAHPDPCTEHAPICVERRGDLR